MPDSLPASPGQPSFIIRAAQCTVQRIVYWTVLYFTVLCSVQCFGLYCTLLYCAAYSELCSVQCIVKCTLQCIVLCSVQHRFYFNHCTIQLTLYCTKLYCTVIKKNIALCNALKIQSFTVLYYTLQFTATLYTIVYTVHCSLNCIRHRTVHCKV